MLGFQCLLLCVLLYSASVDAFGQCADAYDDRSCPDYATCEDEDADSTFECECEDGFDEIDVPGLTIGGTAVTVCNGTSQQSGSGIIRGGVILLTLLAGGAAFLPSLLR